MSQDRDNNYWQVPESGREYAGKLLNPANGGYDPAGFDDLCKVSQKHDVTVRDFVAESGKKHIEDGIDVNNNCERILFKDGRVGAGRKGVAVTIKGGSSSISLEGVVVTDPGRHCDIEIGNHSDQSWKPCERIFIADCRRADGQPVRVAWGRGSRPIIRGGNVRIVWWWTVALHLYVYAKHYFPRLIP